MEAQHIRQVSIAKKRGRHRRKHRIPVCPEKQSLRVKPAGGAISSVDRHHRIFNRLDEGTQRAIEHHGAWRIGNAEALSWRQLAEISPLNSAFAQYEYHLMSLYAHAGYAGIKADQQNDADIPGLLTYLYVLAACYISTLDSIVPGSDANFTSRELACFQELLDVAESWVALPPLPELDESFTEPEE